VTKPGDRPAAAKSLRISADFAERVARFADLPRLDRNLDGYAPVPPLFWPASKQKENCLCPLFLHCRSGDSMHSPGPLSGLPPATSLPADRRDGIRDCHDWLLFPLLRSSPLQAHFAERILMTHSLLHFFFGRQFQETTQFFLHLPLYPLFSEQRSKPARDGSKKRHGP
jgi:hypothetical protein